MLPYSFTVEGHAVPCNFKPSRGAAAAMRESFSSRPPKWERHHQIAAALEYAKWLAQRDGITLPKETAGREAERYGGRAGTRLEVEWGWVENAKPSGRIKALRWVEGFYSEYRDVPRIRKGKPVMINERVSPYWIAGAAEPLVCAIPNWDHVPTVTEVSP